VDRADDFGELHALLHGAGDRYRSARATVVHTVDAAVAQEANRRFVMIGKPGPQDFHYEYEDFERRIRIWHERPDRWREKIYDADGRLDGAEPSPPLTGPGGPTPDPEYETHRAVYVPELPKGQGLDARFAFVLDPSEYHSSETFWDGTGVFRTDLETVFAGRECLEVSARRPSRGAILRKFSVAAMRAPKALRTISCSWTGRSEPYPVWPRGPTAGNSASRPRRGGPGDLLRRAFPAGHLQARGARCRVRAAIYRATRGAGSRMACVAAGAGRYFLGFFPMLTISG
jgi:hypothetical protein